MLTVQIEHPEVDTQQKFIKATNALGKVLGVSFSVSDETEQAHEQSRFKSVRQLEQVSIDSVEMNLHSVYSQLVGELSKADTTYKLHGVTFYNPKTGKLLTTAEWRKIVAELSRVFTLIFKEPEEYIVRRAIALGKILQGLPKRRVEVASWNELQNIHVDFGEQSFSESVQYAERAAAEHITRLAADARSKIATTIIEAQRQRWGERKLQQSLFDKFGELNRDWRRIAVTELAMNTNAGYMLAELGEAEQDEIPLLIGVTARNACPYCYKHIRGKVVALLPSANETGTIEIDGTEYEAVWPGKSNIGRSQSEWWITCPAHPHCRCSWTRYYAELEEALRRRGIRARV